ncbi:HNHc domain-containing protein [Hyphomicrobiales bacterium]|nr:HNHc domain-containing protein [Hyphomicrobiales bacterium]CAH1697564.1 HNHc domain-containing protein [Hyphomicrobiales bacterium]CAI0346319.1 putative restriction endonuclease [Hyphomicrobiales bacterium]
MSGRAWLMLSVAGRRQHGGNAGYDDDPAGVYRYDSSVGNSANVSRGDLVAIRDREGLLAVGLVDSIAIGAGTKTRFRCPVCGITTIKQRQNMTPAWRCRSGHTFDAPNAETIDVTTYAADYTRGQVLLNGYPDAAAARATAMRPSTQNSIEEIDAAALARLVIASRPDTRPVFERFFQSWPADIFSVDDIDADYQPSSEDRRKRILRAISERRGQARFRSDLVKRYGARCLVSGCTVMDVIEAAHIWPYRGTEDNAPSNGLLLRADLHTLYDLDLLGIEPGTECVIRISLALAGTEYAMFEGRPLLAGQRPPSREALQRRWDAFLERARSLDDVSEPSPPDAA